MGSAIKLCVLQLMTISCLAEKQLWNDEIDILLDYFSIGYRASNSTDLPIMDIKNKTMSITGLRLGDISTLKRLSDVVLETSANGDTRLSGSFGLEKFQLKITNARVNGYSGPAIVTSQNNSAAIAYRVTDPDNGIFCRTRWERFRLGEFSEMKVMIPATYAVQQPDVTPEFNRRILPALNRYLNTPEFLATLSKTFDFCNIKRYLFPL